MKRNPRWVLYRLFNQPTGFRLAAQGPSQGPSPAWAQKKFTALALPARRGFVAGLELLTWVAGLFIRGRVDLTLSTPLVGTSGEARGVIWSLLEKRLMRLFFSWKLTLRVRGGVAGSAAGTAFTPAARASFAAFLSPHASGALLAALTRFPSGVPFAPFLLPLGDGTLPAGPVAPSPRLPGPRPFARPPSGAASGFWPLALPFFAAAGCCRLLLLPPPRAPAPRSRPGGSVPSPGSPAAAGSRGPWGSRTSRRCRRATTSKVGYTEYRASRLGCAVPASAASWNSLSPRPGASSWMNGTPSRLARLSRRLFRARLVRPASSSSSPAALLRMLAAPEAPSSSTKGPSMRDSDSSGIMSG
mmetsp:Transcript_11273/g.31635  ORF Transcript_11273/g.31635 Transcript_11273/m.31635 type:complete len:358 (-) Transcript_11273:8-1081(-)